MQSKDMAGVLFRNKRREKDTHPTHQGTVTVNGVEYWLNAWVNESQKTGEKYFSLKLRAKGQQTQPGAPADLDDSIPF